jgi:hypothetical protein
MSGSVTPAVARYPRCVALTQEHRGHGASTAGYYLGRALVAQGLRVLLGDLSQRRSSLVARVAHDPIKNLVPWAPAGVSPLNLQRLIKSARARTSGLADVILLDADATFLERGGGLEAGLDYVVLLIDHTPEAQRDAARLAQRLSREASTRGRVGVVFSRIEAPAAETLPQRLDNSVPVLGWLPADYLLAADDGYSLTGSAPPRPHDAYLQALARLARTLTALVPLQRMSPPHGQTA